MSKFIELSDTENKSVLLNVNHIFKVSRISDENTEICLSVNGYNGFPYQYIKTKMSYETVRKIIENSCD